MSSYRVAPIPDEIPGRSGPPSPRRSTAIPPRRARQGLRPVPLRSACAVRQGREDRVLFTYNPFAGLDPYPSPGPVFIHWEPCAPYDGAGFRRSSARCR